ncbi:serine-rich adhesin for platelets [Chrysoperla carnea]|uniref:serine-rich adhesin for platelets n=1 Tax=Chrysoperla carnea TaxID=189513 RepID=UPI001D073480|nr:serine-rich adhesin for platelets [Chrysoperla carnea]
MAELININNEPGAISSSTQEGDDSKVQSQSEPSTSEESSNSNPSSIVPESPKPLAFVIDFGERKSVDTNRFKNMFEKYQNRHRRGQSLSKIQSPVQKTTNPVQKPPSSVFPRKTDYHSEGYFSSDQEEKSDASFIRQLKMLGLKSNVMNAVHGQTKNDLTLPLQNTTTQRLGESNFDINNIVSPEMDLKDISSPEFDILTPSDPTPCMVKSMPEFNTNTIQSVVHSPQVIQKESSQSMFIPFHPINNNNHIAPSPINNIKNHKVAENTNTNHKIAENTIVNNLTNSISITTTSESTTEESTTNNIDDSYEIQEFEDSDSVSEAGTYTLDADNYTEEQKARMSIDREITNIPELSAAQRTQHFVESTLQYVSNNFESETTTNSVGEGVKNINLRKTTTEISIDGNNSLNLVKKNVILNNIDSIRKNKNTNKILFASSKAKNGCGLEQEIDTGRFTSITTCGVFNQEKNRTQSQTVELSPEKKSPSRRNSLTRSDVYFDNIKQIDQTVKKPPISPTKIPSPIHSLSRPRSRASADLSDSSVETDCYLKHTQNVISNLQARLTSDTKYDQQRNKIAQNILKNQTKHIRHNSYDSKNTNNKLENFQAKLFTTNIDQTPNIATRSPTHKLYNSPNNSPIKRSSSFSVKHLQTSTEFGYINSPISSPRVPKETNLLRMSPNLNDNSKVHRSSSTASIKKHLNPYHNRRHSANSPENRYVSSNESLNQQKTTRHENKNQILVTSESSSDDDFGNNIFIRNKEVNNITNTRHNRAFSLRRARLDLEPVNTSKCPNTPEMRRKFVSNTPSSMAITTPELQKKTGTVRSASIDSRKPEVKSRYLSNITKNTKPVATTTISNASSVNNVLSKSVPNNRSSSSSSTVSSSGVVKSSSLSVPPKNTAIARTDSGRFSMRAVKPKQTVTTPKTSNKKGNRSNSTLTSREVEFQNWKRRKSYDPMKAAAEGKRKAELNKKLNQNNSNNIMTQSYTQTSQECDSSPSHSSSVHRSQSFHGTGGLDNYISSDEDLTLSADDGEGITPPAPTPNTRSPDKVIGSQSHVKQAWCAKNTRY